MEDKERYTGTSSELHKKLGSVAEELGVERDRAWPKSARWLWKRINEVLPLLTAVGIEAERGRDNTAKQITLRKFPKSDGTNGTEGKSPTAKPKDGANTDEANGTSNGTSASNGTSNGTSEAHTYTGSTNSANSANKSGDSWQGDPMRHYGRGGAP